MGAFLGVLVMGWPRVHLDPEEAKKQRAAAKLRRLWAQLGGPLS